MAIILSNGTGGGLASVTTSWAGGVVPTVADDAAVLAGDTITLDGAIQWNSMQVGGTLAASRTMSSSLTVFGQFGTSTSAILGGQIDFGTAASPIPAAFLAELIFDATVNGTIYQFDDGAGFFTHGATTRTRGTQLTAATLFATAPTIVTVKDATGWAVGDGLVFEHPNQAGFAQRSTHYDNIASIVGNQITLTTGVTYDLPIDTIVGNDTSNVIVKSNDPLEAFNVHNPVLLFDTLSAASDNKFIAINTSFRGLGTGGYRKYGLSFSGDPTRFEVVANPYRGLLLEGCAFANNGIDIALLR
ncbi:MAG: hypothetical protein R8M45_00805, partial [Ghiorsea sp.]